MVAALLILAACGGGPLAADSTPVSSEPSTSTTAPPDPATTTGGELGIPVCDELEWFTGPEELYLDHPVYVANEMPTEEVMSYASSMDGFVEVWIDRVHNGWVNVGFTDVDIAAAQAELDGLFSGRGVVAVDLPYTHAELEEIRAGVQRLLPVGMDAANTHILHGRVEVWIRVLDPDRIEALAQALGDEPVCVVGTPLEDAILAGPQPTGGDGWTFLAAFDDSVGPITVVGDQAAYGELWAAFGAGDPPAVDFEASVVVALEIGYSGSCRETRLDGVHFTDASIDLEVNTVTDELVCTDDYNARTYLVALDRSRLPAPPFTIGRFDWGRAAGEVTDDLRPPASTVTELSEAPRPERKVGLPDFVEPGFPSPALIDLSCGIDWIGEVNRVAWHTDAPTPGSWEEAAGDGQVVEVAVLLSEGPEPTLTLSAHGEDVVYTPSSSPGPKACFDTVP